MREFSDSHVPAHREPKLPASLVPPSAARGFLLHLEGQEGVTGPKLETRWLSTQHPGVTRSLTWGSSQSPHVPARAPSEAQWLP